MHRIMLVVILAVSCSADRVPQDTSSDTEIEGATDAAAALAKLTGLYESGNGRSRSQLCILEEKRENAFALVAFGAGGHSCSGSGTVTRDGRRLVFRMTGDSSCTITATISGISITFASEVPGGCSYYCGARATLANVHWTQTGATSAAARKAKDLVGGPLC